MTKQLFAYLRPVLMGAVSQEFVLGGAVIILTWNLTGLVLEAFMMEQLFAKFCKTGPNRRPNVPIFKTGAYILELLKKLLHRTSFEYKPSLIPS